ncbi:transposase [Candidatus Dojkabacteria bacterium]|nr:transposase [Candidatus Dojkabacteria bacterium]
MRYLGSDNGGELMGDLDWLLKERKIIYVFFSPRSPKQNPFVERVIRTVIDEVYYYEGTQPTREEQQKELDEYVKVYNEERLHRRLNLRTHMEQFKILNNKAP